jgi:tetratricopeptide (TPR) repeat protein/nitrate/TMAO reductase-like tetraheme cytochrome c subunit
MATAFNVANLLLHVGLGAALGVGALLLLSKGGRTSLSPTDASSFVRKASLWTELSVPLCVLAATLSGVLLAYLGNTHDHHTVLLIHVYISLIAVAALFVWREHLVFAKLAAAAAALVVLAGVADRYWIKHPEKVIANSQLVPASMEQEGAGPKSPFFPSGANTADGKLVPSSFFMESKKCGECHKDIYEQWQGSVHHFASFNNQFYRKSIEYMQSVVGTQPSKWCAGCHDHAVFFNGRFDKPIKEQIDTPEAQAGLSCMSCHSIVHVNGSVGNGSFTMSYPPLHEVANSSNPFVRKLERFVTYAAPEAHRQTFMKPFMKDNSEFCSACHKVHLDIPVNSYRWFRGFNDYDNWQASGVSGLGARSFYYPPKSSRCSGCHMPMVASHDPGNLNGQIHSHRFPGANTAVPYVNQDAAQLAATEKFLKSGFITVDIFAVTPVQQQKTTAMVRRNDSQQTANTGFAVGEEAEQNGAVLLRNVGEVAAPANASNITLKPGETVQVDVVVRTRKIGHFFPGGTVDSFDVWLELEAADDNGKPIFWSGRVDDNGKGPVEPGAHFYRSLQLDGEGNPINKRNAWQARSLLYAHLIPPGAADVAHYLVKVPAGARGKIHLTAKLNYRKFAWYYTHFSYAGEPKAGQDVKLLLAKNFNSLDYSFDRANIPANVSGQIKNEIPNLPIVTLSKAELELPVSDQAPVWSAVAKTGTRERWNDWGIGLLLQGDLKGAEFAFKKATEAEPGYADAWLNTARALIQEGETDAAKPYIEKALQLNPTLGRIYYFRALIEKTEGRYDDALASLAKVETQYPRDRVALNQIARILLLKRQYGKALEYCQRVCDVDTEDVQMHYTAMLCYKGLGETEKANREQALFQRFKADESAQAITAKRRMASPEDNNERQPVHSHESAPLP